ncbi:hypothetical protein PHYPSEUDO_008273 [Phytophthora pseudosyringae]|uniref:Uncharacterized protein n=1 Tax=Phytophthora pseudosyringae TaxID=221518 RepID=A0A8T1VEH9_9STRA|nr:hypothetical protein PHYPSEUDO_008273 [Phytophthora pseudosyringae]
MATLRTFDAGKELTRPHSTGQKRQLCDHHSGSDGMRDACVTPTCACALHDTRWNDRTAEGDGDFRCAICANAGTPLGSQARQYATQRARGVNRQRQVQGALESSLLTRTAVLGGGADPTAKAWVQRWSVHARNSFAARSKEAAPTTQCPAVFPVRLAPPKKAGGDGLHSLRTKRTPLDAASGAVRSKPAHRRWHTPFQLQK